MKKIAGTAIASGILRCLRAAPPPKKELAVVLAGRDRASVRFVEKKVEVGKRLGVRVRLYRVGSSVTTSALKDLLRRIVSRSVTGGIVVQLPLPSGVNRDEILAEIPREKDVDVIGGEAFRIFSRGASRIFPPVVGALQEILRREAMPLRSKTVAVVGRGFLVGKPIAAWLRGVAKKVLLIRSEKEFPRLLRADLVISGVGRAGLIKSSRLKDGAAVVDFGYSWSNGRVKGDFDADAARRNRAHAQRIRFYTPTPGGTGPIVVAKLFENFYLLNK